MSRFTKVVLASAVLGALAVPAQAAQRAFVSSSGSDANTATGCLFSAPCRGFTAAHSVVDPGGEIIALDTAGYGAVTITKSVSLIGNPGFYAGIAASSGNAITIATGGVSVIVRGLNINGIGANNGISMSAGSSLTIENCVISNFLQYGVNVYTNAAVRIIDSVVRGNGGLDGIRIGNGANASVQNVKMSANGRAGLVSEDGPAVTTVVAVSDSDSSANAFGFASFAPAGGQALLTITRTTAAGNGADGVIVPVGAATATVGGSTISHNFGVGLNNISGVLRTQGNNLVNDNGANTAGTITMLGSM